MKKLRKLTLACFLTYSSFAVVGLAQTSTTLQVGTPIERELGQKQVHSFTVAVEENSLIEFVVEQKGIDVVVTVVSPDGKTLGEYDTPNGANGPEHVSFVALVAGSYSITVEPLDPANAKNGRYQIKLLNLRKATEDEQKTRQALEIARTKGIELLKDLEGIISQIKTPETRIKARIDASNLLLEHDEKRSSKYLANAIADLKELVASLDVNDPDYFLQQYTTIWQLRFELVQMFADTDPDAALNLIYSTVPPISPYHQREQVSQENNLELSIANQLLEKNPQRSLQIARRSLKQGYSLELIRTIEQLKLHDVKSANELANEVADKLLNENLIRNAEAVQLTINLLGPTQMAGSIVVNNVATIADIRPENKQKELLPEDKQKQLLQKLLNEVLSYSPTDASHNSGPNLWNVLNTLKSMGTELDKSVSGSSTAVAKKYAELTGGANHYLQIPTSLSESVDEALQSIEKEAPEKREQMYLMLANREASKGELQRARQIINEHITSPFQRRESLNQVEQQEITRAINTGKLEDALRMIGSLRTPRVRASYLSNLAGNIASEQKRPNALSLLEQARALLAPSPQAQDEQQMNTLLEIARAFSRYDSKRAFEIIDPLIDQFNDLCAAARTLEGFGEDHYQNDELNLRNGNSMAQVGNQMSAVIGSLALTNFERAKAMADRIGLPEVRLRVFLEMATQAIEGTP